MGIKKKELPLPTFENYLRNRVYLKENHIPLLPQPGEKGGLKIKAPRLGVVLLS